MLSNCVTRCYLAVVEVWRHERCSDTRRRISKKPIKAYQ